MGKSCKPIPVMILGVLFGRKSYPLAKYLFILTVVIGVVLFMYKDKPAAVVSDANSGIGFGEILLVRIFSSYRRMMLTRFTMYVSLQLVSLLMDGLTGAIQERMKLEYQSKSGHMMLYMNLWSVGYLAAGIDRLRHRFCSQ